MRVCLYQRISTDEDHQPTSLKTQRERLERYCEAMENWRIVAAYEDQASGTSLDRPGLQAGTRPRAREADRPAVGLQRRPALTEGASACRAVRGTGSARRRLEVGDRAVRYRLTGRADDAADARRLRRVRTRHHRRPRHRGTRTPRPRRQMDERPHPLRLHPRQRHEAARSGSGEGADRTAHLRPLCGRGSSARRRSRARSKREGSTAAAQAGLVAERAATDPRQPRVPQPRPLERGDASPACTSRSSTTTPSSKAQEILRRRSEDASLRAATPATSFSPDSSVVTTAVAPTSAPQRTDATAATPTTPAPPATSTARPMHRRPAPQGPARSRRPHPTRRAVPRRRCDQAGARRPGGVCTESELPRTRGTTRIDTCGDRTRRRQAGTLVRGTRRPTARRRPLQDRVRGHRDRLEALGEGETDLAARLARQAHTPPDGAALQGLADQLEAIVAREPGTGQGTTPRARRSDPSTRPPPDHPHLQDPAAVRAIPRKVDLTGRDPSPAARAVAGRALDPRQPEPALAARGPGETPPRRRERGVTGTFRCRAPASSRRAASPSRGSPRPRARRAASPRRSGPAGRRR